MLLYCYLFYTFSTTSTFDSNDIFFLFLFYFAYDVFSFFFFSSRRRHTRSDRDWSSDVCSSDLRARCRCRSGWARCSWTRRALVARLVQEQRAQPERQRQRARHGPAGSRCEGRRDRKSVV